MCYFQELYNYSSSDPDPIGRVEKSFDPELKTEGFSTSSNNTVLSKSCYLVIFDSIFAVYNTYYVHPENPQVTI